MKKKVCIFLILVSMFFVMGCEKEEHYEDENLVEYGSEYADYDFPAEEIAWELANTAQEEYELYDAELNIQSYEGNPVSGFKEELDVYVLSCYPLADFYENNLLVGSTIRVACGQESGELRNITGAFKDEYIDYEELVYNIFHNSDIEGLGELYDKLETTETVYANGYEMRIVDNIVALSYDHENAFYNIWFLPHSVYVEDEKLYYITGDEVDVNLDWLL